MGERHLAGGGNGDCGSRLSACYSELVEDAPWFFSEVCWGPLMGGVVRAVGEGKGKDSRDRFPELSCA